jgi:hypothetical protein
MVVPVVHSVASTATAASTAVPSPIREATNTLVEWRIKKRSRKAIDAVADDECERGGEREWDDALWVPKGGAAPVERPGGAEARTGECRPPASVTQT